MLVRLLLAVVDVTAIVELVVVVIVTVRQLVIIVELIKLVLIEQVPLISHLLAYSLVLVLPIPFIRIETYLGDHDNDEISLFDRVILESFVIVFHDLTISDQLH
jgi:hypothetical protein